MNIHMYTRQPSTCFVFNKCFYILFCNNLGGKMFGNDQVSQMFQQSSSDLWPVNSDLHPTITPKTGELPSNCIKEIKISTPGKMPTVKYRQIYFYTINSNSSSFPFGCDLTHNEGKENQSIKCSVTQMYGEPVKNPCNEWNAVKLHTHGTV